MPKVYVELNDARISSMFVEEGWETTHFLEDANLVCFSGGADVSPELYGERNTASHSYMERDFQSIVLYMQARRLGKPMVGICRGGQFLNVMNGGRMIQDYPGHAIHGTHLMKDLDLGVFEVTSAHHQVMIPAEHAFLLAWANVQTEEGDQTEAEVIEYDGCICFQPHPEYVPKGHECREYFFSLLEGEFFLSTGEE